VAGRDENSNRAISQVSHASLYHYDDAVRFNAIQLLDDAGYLTSNRISTLLRAERDPETIELLQMLTNE
jgi:hypothetical protein